MGNVGGCQIIMQKIKKQDTYNMFLWWFVLPDKEKEQVFGYTTEVEFSRAYRISRKQLWVWKGRPEFSDDVFNEIRTNAAVDQVQIYHAMLDRAKKNGKYAMVWLKIFNLLGNRNEPMVIKFD